ncbi:hypothetical protein [Downy mildew lesion associated ormycovirus 1]|uniref:Uncharacterized protein n=1 Tax=Downy mildew lesion associated ormycovirus 1 TaxID=3162769 RepID=A0AAT9QDV9_9VIRU|nr:hypothetical protein [Plasmopara viticola lesion-associated ormycovirus 1]
MLEPWFVDESGPNMIVTVPSDVESLADDPAAQVAVAACVLLKCEYRVGLAVADRPLDWTRPHHETELFYSGMAAALAGGSIGRYPNYSGWFGKGFNLVAKRAISKGGIKPWCLRGPTMPFRKVFAYKGWGDKLPSGYRHLEVLVARASDAMTCLDDNIGSWLMPLSALKGTKIKKALASKKVGFLTEYDVQAFSIRFETGYKAFSDLEARLLSPSRILMENLEKEIEAANKAISESESLAGRIIESRAAVLYPPEKRKRGKKSRKIPLKEKLSQLDPVTYINKFSPCEACGLSKFTVSESMAYSDDDVLKIDQLTHEWDRYITSKDAKFKEVLSGWWNTEVHSRYFG